MTKHPEIDLDADLGVGDPLTHWLRRALKRSPIVNIPHEQIESSFATVMNTFGKEWLERTCERRRRDVTWNTSPHFVGNILTLAGDRQIVMLVELGHYLRLFREVKGFNELIPILKIDTEGSVFDRDYLPSAFLQLALAHRFSRVGCQVYEFEPQALKGRKGDLCIAIEGETLGVECYAPRLPYKDVGAEMAYTVKPIDQAVRQTDQVIAVQVVLTRDITTPIRTRITQEVKKAVARLKTHGVETIGISGATILVKSVGEFPDATSLLRAAPLTSVTDPSLPERNPDWAVRSSYWPRSRVDELRDSEVEVEGTDYLALEAWRAEAGGSSDSAERFIERSIQRAKKKASQAHLRVGDTQERIVTMEIGEGRWISEHEEQLRTAINDASKSQGPKDPRIVAFGRDWHPQGKRFVFTDFIDSDLNRDSIAAVLVRKLNIAEPISCTLADGYSPSGFGIRGT